MDFLFYFYCFVHLSTSKNLFNSSNKAVDNGHFFKVIFVLLFSLFLFFSFSLFLFWGFFMAIAEALRVVVESEFVEQRSGEKNGKAWAMSTQFAWAYIVDQTGVAEKFPSKIKITLEKGAPPYRPGEYILSPASFYRGDFDSLNMRVALVPAAVVALKAA